MDAIPGLIKQGGDNFSRNVTRMWDGMRLRDYLRLLVVVGGYLLLRPYLLKLGAKIQAREHAKQLKLAEEQEKTGAKISPNMLRGGVLAAAAEEEDEAVDASGADWGKKARKRQRQFVKKVLDEEERLKAENEVGEEDDKDIMQYLVDYEEGKDGW